MEHITDVYSSYNAMSSQIMESLSQMSKICDELGMEERAASLGESRRKLQEHKFAVGILGEFKRGKSTVINAMLQQEIMPADILPCSATMNRVTYGLTPSAQLLMMDGSRETIAVEELAQHVTKLDSDSSARAAAIEEAIVFYPCRFCQNGVDIVDTPGLNDDERMNKITEEVVPKLDAVIMVLVADNPFSMSEAEFVRSKLMCSDIGRLIFLVNKIDTVRPKDRQRVLASIREKIQLTVLDKTKEIYGEDSDQYRSVEAKLADIQIYPISAMQALEGYEDGDDHLVEKSGMTAFEGALSRMLTEERGVLELLPPVTKLMNIGMEASETITQLRTGLHTDQESFKETQRKILMETKELSAKKDAERTALKAKAREMKRDLTGQTEVCYREIEEKAELIINSMQPDDPKKPLSAQQMQELVIKTQEKLKSMVSTVLSKHYERLAAQLNAAIQAEQAHISADLIAETSLKMNQHFNSMSQLSSGAVSGGSSILGTAGSIVMDTLAETLLLSGLPVLGVGGLVEGYKAAGIKGAALGGVSGALISVATLALLPSTMALLPGLAIMAAAGTVGSKGIVNLIFRGDKAKKQLDQVREQVREEVRKSILNMRMSRDLEKWIEEQVSSQFDDLIQVMTQECDKIIAEANRKVSEITKNLSIDQTERKHKLDDLAELEQELTTILTTLMPISQKVMKKIN